jgi:hypothetical protein
MKTFLLSLSITFTAFYSQSQVDSVALLQYYLDNMNAVTIVTMEPNEKYLKTLSNIYIPSVEEYEKDPLKMTIFVGFLESRYKCSIDFVEETSTNGVRDIVFLVAQMKENPLGILFLNLSELEQLYQEGELIKQLDEYSKWSELVINF